MFLGGGMSFLSMHTKVGSVRGMAELYRTALFCMLVVDDVTLPCRELFQIRPLCGLEEHLRSHTRCWENSTAW